VQLERTANILSDTPAAAEQAIQLDRQRLRAGSTSVLWRGLKKVCGETISSALTASAKKVKTLAYVKAQFSALCKFVTMSERLPEALPLWMLFQYELLKFPPALYLQDGYLRKSKKSEMLPLLLPPDGEQPAASGHACIVQRQSQQCAGSRCAHGDSAKYHWR